MVFSQRIFAIIFISCLIAGETLDANVPYEIPSLETLQPTVSLSAESAAEDTVADEVKSQVLEASLQSLVAQGESREAIQLEEAQFWEGNSVSQPKYVMKLRSGQKRWIFAATDSTEIKIPLLINEDADAALEMSEASILESGRYQIQAGGILEFQPEALFRFVGWDRISYEIGEVQGTVFIKYNRSLRPMPNSDRFLGAQVSFSHYAVGYYKDYGWDSTPLITDASGVNHGQSDDLSPDYNQMLQHMASQNPEIMMGSYLSGWDVGQTPGIYFPRNRIEAQELIDKLPAGMPLESIFMGRNLIPGEPYQMQINYADPEVRKVWADLIFNEIVMRNPALAYLDNTRHPSLIFSQIPWSVTTEALSEVRQRLHAQGIRVITNVAWGIYDAETADIQLFMKAVDGASFEMAFPHPFGGGSAPEILERLKKAYENYRLMLGGYVDPQTQERVNGITAVTIPNYFGDTPEEIMKWEKRGEVEAAWSMMVRNPGDKIFVSHAFWRPTPDWVHWPSEFGEPLGDAVLQIEGGEVKMERIFENGTLQLIFSAAKGSEEEPQVVFLKQPNFKPRSKSVTSSVSAEMPQNYFRITSLYTETLSKGSGGVSDDLESVKKKPQFWSRLLKSQSRVPAVPDKETYKKVLISPEEPITAPALLIGKSQTLPSNPESPESSKS